MPISIVPHKHQTTILRRATGGNHARTQSQRRLTSHVPDGRITMRILQRTMDARTGWKLKRNSLKRAQEQQIRG